MTPEDAQPWSMPDPTLGGLAPDGWMPAGFADRLEQLAAGCESLNADLADQHRKQAAAIRAALRGNQ